MGFRNIRRSGRSRATETVLILYNYELCGRGAIPSYSNLFAIRASGPSYREASEVENDMIDPDHASSNQCGHDVGDELHVDVIMKLIVNLTTPE